MSLAVRTFVVALVVACVAACGGDDAPDPPTATMTPSATPTATLEPSATSAPPTVTAIPEPSPTPSIVRQDIQATHLSIPAVGIDSPVQASVTVPYVYVPAPGCSPGPSGAETVTVPDQGIATPEDNIEGLENKAWIFGHSRWLGVPGVLFGLQDVSLGDEVIVDGRDRQTGEPLTQARFVVDGIYLADIDSGDTFLTAEDAGEIPREPVVVLQTSVRERGEGRTWIFDRERLQARAENIVEGDLDDPCKYLLLFITASPG